MAKTVGQWLDDEISKLTKRDVGTYFESVRQERTKVVKQRFDFRKLAAIEPVFHGYKLVFAEYAFGVLFSIALGISFCSWSFRVASDAGYVSNLLGNQL